MIGGNVVGRLLTQTGYVKNKIGESVPQFATVKTLRGFLDYLSGSSNYSNYSAKIQESTHLFICDYVPLNSKIKAENSRLEVDGKLYDVMLIDNPMGLNKQYEIYLKYTGD